MICMVVIFFLSYFFFVLMFNFFLMNLFSLIPVIGKVGYC